MIKTYILTGKFLLLFLLTFCLVQCNEGEGITGSGGEIEIRDSLPTGTFQSEVSDITITPEESSLTVTWKAPANTSDLSHYLIEWQGSKTDATLYSAPTRATTYKITRLYNENYKVGIKTVSKNLLQSKVVYASGAHSPVKDYQAPEKVSQLTVSPVATSAAFAWINPEDQDFEYTIVRMKQQSATEWTINDTLSAIESEWNIAGLDQKTTYDYSIQTFDYIGNGSVTETGNFKTKTEVKLKKVDDSGQSLWNIADFSSEETGGDNGYAANAIDGNDNTFWHSVWYSGHFGDGSKTGTLPQYIVIDLQQTVIPSVVSLYRRNGSSGGPTSAKVESTLEDPTSKNTEWNNLGTYVLNGGTDNGPLPCNIKILKEARYLKITILSANNNVYAMIREIDVNALVDEE